MQKRKILRQIVGLVGFSALGSAVPGMPSAFAASQSGPSAVPVNIRVEPYLCINGACGFVTPCGAKVWVAPPPCTYKQKSYVSTFTVYHNMDLDLRVWRCGGAGSYCQPPKAGNGITYKIELFADGATAPFYVYGPAALSPLTPISLTSILHSQSHGTTRVRVTRQAKDPKYLIGDWLTMSFEVR